MVGGNDFRPEPKRRVPDPSLEEMLRRARDAPLGDDLGLRAPQVPSFTPVTTHRWGRDTAPQGYLLFWAGILVGALIGYLTAQANVGAGRTTRSTPPAVSYVPATATAAPPTPTDTPLPTPTDLATATATPALLPTPTTGELANLAQQYYDTAGSLASAYVFVDATGEAVVSQDAAQLTVCITFEYAPAATPDTVSGMDTRPFTLLADSSGVWYVVRMGESGSCSSS